MGKKYRRKIQLVCDFRQEFVEYWTDNICEPCGISFINDQFLFRKKGNVLLSNPHSCEKREPSNHLPTNIFDILLGIWYLWLLYRVHLGLLRDRTTFTPYAVPFYTAGSLFQAMWRNTYEQASQVICFISPPLGTRMVR